MDNFLSVIIFILPGFIASFFVKLFGLNSSVKHRGEETLAISSIMWIPINIFVIGIYSIMVFNVNHHFKAGIPYIHDFDSLNRVSNSFLFIAYYVISSIFWAYLLAKGISGKSYSYFLGKVNKIRKKNGKAPLSREPTVWENTFTKNTVQIVKISSLNNDRGIIGEIKRASAKPNNEKDIVLRYIEHWTAIMKEFEVEVSDIYFDSNSGFKIEIYDRDQCLKAQDLYLEMRDKN